jgi:hypothetical protein
MELWSECQEPSVELLSRFLVAMLQEPVDLSLWESRSQHRGEEP